jgi:hypothetical protein
MKNGQLYKEFGRLSPPVSQEFEVSFSDAIIGSNYRFSYIPLLHNSRKHAIQTSEIVTYVGGHKYSLSDVAIYIDDNDKTDDILNSDAPYLYSNPGASESIVLVNFSVDHATYTTPYSNLERCYPFISGAYLMVVPPIYQKPIYQDIIYEEPAPLGAAATYPNCSYAMADYLKGVYNTTPASRKDHRYFDETTIDLSNEVLSGIVTGDSNWHVYLIIEDEFLQRSAFCVTNLGDNYKIPFRR